MSWAESQKSNCQSTIESNNIKIKKYEQLYDSLKQFQGVVSDSQGYFSNVNANKKKYLSDLTFAVINCKTATSYSVGMNKVLNGIGEMYVNCTYSALLFTIGLKLAEYVATIKALEASNAALYGTIASLDAQIRKEAENSKKGNR